MNQNLLDGERTRFSLTPSSMWVFLQRAMMCVITVTLSKQYTQSYTDINLIQMQFEYHISQHRLSYKKMKFTLICLKEPHGCEFYFYLLIYFKSAKICTKSDSLVNY